MCRTNRGVGSGIEYIDDPECIWGNNNFLDLVEKHYLYRCLIIPDRLVKDKLLFEIINLKPLYFIHGFIVIVENTLVRNVLLIGYHPNRDPDTGLYCLQESKRNVPYNDDYVQLLVRNIKTYYLNNCFYIPPGIEYKKMDCMYVEMNKGD